MADFNWENAPMREMEFMIVGELFYFGGIFGLKFFLGPLPPGAKQQDTPTLKFLLSLHNAILCLLSLVMFLGAAYELVKRSSYDGIEWMFCEKIGTQAKGGLFYWSYIYYLSKYLEFFDTFFKVLKRKPLDFLHVYHHAVVVLMCWNWLEYSQSLQPPPWWKRYITRGQIIQFQTSFILALPFFVLDYYKTRVLKGEGCEGRGAVYFNAAFNFSLLLLFINFSRKTYRDKDAQTKKD
ncbi:hypothetical protein GUITHDRAFT_137321 [Guillardia theta CCMP2712]|uniref:Elongation of fatty acids protein n=1 Tax=Guillardia theta (strain CCMP2712) TaxID=905079 RepID=L1JG91_GUITC|nr:hypothetical protein GUITHDRAFT_137321 [Guillardia theta CCMP2712]EKX47538.1 hypothetical protein GUITHDRAFT_137321 [Guillardia theta CCMP2712]|eukprot:XP_005834518.1 hypothetical protein GUITHDRAFT_137321 [Guillardia theta CCMP2712]